MRTIILEDHSSPGETDDNRNLDIQVTMNMMDNYRRITSDLLRDRLRKGESTLILDLRTPAEFDDEHISGSINIPLENLNVESFLDEHGPGPIFLVCSTGKKAYRAADVFFAAGCSEIIIMAGGLLSWRALGFPLVRQQLKPT